MVLSLNYYWCFERILLRSVLVFSSWLQIGLVTLEVLPPTLMNLLHILSYHHILVSSELNTFPDLSSHAHLPLDRHVYTLLLSPQSSSQLTIDLCSRHWFSVCQIWDSQLCVAGGKLWMDVWKFNDATLSVDFSGCSMAWIGILKLGPETVSQRKKGKRGLVRSWKIYGCSFVFVPLVVV